MEIRINENTMGNVLINGNKDIVTIVIVSHGIGERLPR